MAHLMVKCAKLNIVLNGKSTFCIALESLGRRLKARVVNALGKCVRERTKCKKVTNESGTAAITASYAQSGCRGLFCLRILRSAAVYEACASGRLIIAPTWDIQ